ncbi:MAG: serine hydrolase [Bacteroidales bacterium]|nr:serine hydrolase [Bacteroidales bacterium]
MKMNFPGIIVAFLMLATSACGQHQEQVHQPDTLPFALNDSLRPLRTLVDSKLQKELVRKLNTNPKWARLINQRKMAIGLVDLRDPYAVKYARVNGNVMMYAASLPKIAILLAAEDALEKGEIQYTADVKQDMRIMISRSNNEAATRMMDRLGFKKIESVLTDPKYDLYDDEFGGGLWVGKRYSKFGERYPEHIKGLSHAATVSQVCRFYYMLAFGKLVSFDRSKQMLEIMGDPELHHKFVNSLEKIAPKAKLYRKSGSWKNFHSDSILVWEMDGRKYILVALIEDPDGEKIIRDLAYTIEDVLRNYSSPYADKKIK